MATMVKYVRILPGAPAGPYPITGVGFAPTQATGKVVQGGSTFLDTFVANQVGAGAQDGGYRLDGAGTGVWGIGPNQISGHTGGISVASWDPDGFTLNLAAPVVQVLHISFWFSD